VESLCVHSCDKQLEAGSQKCGGMVLKCLSENVEKLQSKACKDEVFYFQKREVADIQLDVPLQQACKEDLAQALPLRLQGPLQDPLLPAQQPRVALSRVQGRGAALQHHGGAVASLPARNSNSPLQGLLYWSCRTGTDVCAPPSQLLLCPFLLWPGLRHPSSRPPSVNACGLELQHFCRGVQPGEGQAFRCLQANVQEVSQVPSF